MAGEAQSEIGVEEFRKRLEALADSRALPPGKSVAWMAEQLGRSDKTLYGWFHRDAIPLYAEKVLEALERETKLEEEARLLSDGRKRSAAQFVLDLRRARLGMRQAFQRLVRRMERAEEVLVREIGSETIEREQREKVEAETRELAR